MGKLRKRLRTPESSYVLPILQALDQMGLGQSFRGTRRGIWEISEKGRAFLKEQ
ncbi:hypothetical protein HMPREF1705_03338 [Acetomicrobium hydrogeniformans ATCC BAA-1850]|uniref:Restriction system protein Mrr-like N-terminal domain-containing protein n=1 Tax=Acetomicrobium hydrogeniformans ATCC BAA-1850 TaxID=592015 RepID=A0A0T5XCI6_9BACT|nr:hypothetical protein HMPREF1705_03338 [Acetomicrobium hydrogeniformans ATCC BAA-1850]